MAEGNQLPESQGTGKQPGQVSGENKGTPNPSKIQQRIKGLQQTAGKIRQRSEDFLSQTKRVFNGERDTASEEVAASKPLVPNSGGSESFSAQLKRFWNGERETGSGGDFPETVAELVDALGTPASASEHYGVLASTGKAPEAGRTTKTSRPGLPKDTSGVEPPAFLLGKTGETAGEKSSPILPTPTGPSLEEIAEGLKAASTPAGKVEGETPRLPPWPVRGEGGQAGENQGALPGSGISFDARQAAAENFPGEERPSGNPLIEAAQANPNRENLKRLIDAANEDVFISDQDRYDAWKLLYDHAADPDIMGTNTSVDAVNAAADLRQMIPPEMLPSYMRGMDRDAPFGASEAHIPPVPEDDKDNEVAGKTPDLDDAAGANGQVGRGKRLLQGAKARLGAFGSRVVQGVSNLASGLAAEPAAPGELPEQSGLFSSEAAPASEPIISSRAHSVPPSSTPAVAAASQPPATKGGSTPVGEAVGSSALQSSISGGGGTPGGGAPVDVGLPEPITPPRPPALKPGPAAPASTPLGTGSASAATPIESGSTSEQPGQQSSGSQSGSPITGLWGPPPGLAQPPASQGSAPRPPQATPLQSSVSGAIPSQPESSSNGGSTLTPPPALGGTPGGQPAQQPGPAPITAQPVQPGQSGAPVGGISARPAGMAGAAPQPGNNPPAAPNRPAGPAGIPLQPLPATGAIDTTAAGQPGAGAARGDLRPPRPLPGGGTRLPANNGGGNPPENFTPPPRGEPPVGGEPAPQPDRQQRLRSGIKGIFAHVKEHQRIKQQERGMLGKIVHGMFDPLLTYVDAGRLRLFVARQRANGVEPILTDALVKSVLDRRGQPRESVRSSAAAHRGILRQVGAVDAQSLTDVQITQARTLVTAVIKNVLTPTPATAQALENLRTQYDENLIFQIQQAAKHIFDLGEEAGIKFQTAESFTKVVGDQLIFGGLTPRQQEIARSIMWRAHGSFALTAARIAAGAATGGMGFWASVGINAGVSMASRGATLYTQQGSYAFNQNREAKIQNVNVVQPGVVAGILARSRLARWMSVDWERAGEGRYRWQILRAALSGAAVGAVIKGVEHFDVTHAFGGVDVSHHGAPPEVPLPQGQVHDVVINGHHYEVPGNVQFNQSNGDLFFMDHGKEIDIAHVDNSGIHDLNGYHIAETPQPGVPENLHDYLQDHGSQHISSEHHDIYADQRQYEAYVSTDQEGNVNLTLPPTDNAIGIPQADGSVEMLPFHPGDPGVSVNEDGIMTIHLAPNDPMYQVLIDSKEMNQFFLDKGGHGTMLDGVHNGATTTYVTGHFDGSTFTQHSTVNGSAPLPDQVQGTQTLISVTHEEPAVIENGGDVYHTGFGAWLDQHVLGDDEAHFVDNTIYGTEGLNPNWLEVAGTAAAVAAGYLLGRLGGARGGHTDGHGGNDHGGGGQGNQNNNQGNQPRSPLGGRMPTELGGDSTHFEVIAPTQPGAATGGGPGAGGTNPPGGPAGTNNPGEPTNNPTNPGGGPDPAGNRGAGNQNPGTGPTGQQPGTTPTTQADIPQLPPLPMKQRGQATTGGTAGGVGPLTRAESEGLTNPRDRAYIEGEAAPALELTPEVVTVEAHLMGNDARQAYRESMDLLARPSVTTSQVESALNMIGDDELASFITDEQYRRLEAILSEENRVLTPAEKEELGQILPSLHVRPSTVVRGAQQLLPTLNPQSEEYKDLHDALELSPAGRALLYVQEHKADDPASLLQGAVEYATEEKVGHAGGKRVVLLEPEDWDIVEGIAQAVYGDIKEVQYDMVLQQYQRTHVPTDIPRPAEAFVHISSTPATVDLESFEEGMEAAVAMSPKEVNRRFESLQEMLSAKIEGHQVLEEVREFLDGRPIPQGWLYDALREVQSLQLTSERAEKLTQLMETLSYEKGRVAPFITDEMRQRAREVVESLYNIKSSDIIREVQGVEESLEDWQSSRERGLLLRLPAGRAYLSREYDRIFPARTNGEIEKILREAVEFARQGKSMSEGQMVDWVPLTPDDIEGISQAVFGDTSHGEDVRRVAGLLPSPSSEPRPKSPPPPPAGGDRGGSSSWGGPLTPPSAPAFEERGGTNSPRTEGAPLVLSPQALAENYDAVLRNRITDVATIRRILAQFEMVASDPVLSEQVPFDAAAGAQNLMNHLYQLELREVEAKAAMSESEQSLPIREFAIQLGALRQKVGQELGLASPDANELFQRIEGALISNRGLYYTARRGASDVYATTSELIARACEDFNITSGEKQKALQQYVDNYQSMRERSMYDSALRMNALSSHDLSFAEYEAQTADTSEAHIKRLYEEFTATINTPRENREIEDVMALIIAKYIHLGTPYTDEANSLYSSTIRPLFYTVFGTDFVNSTTGDSHSEGNKTYSVVEDQLTIVLMQKLGSSASIDSLPSNPKFTAMNDSEKADVLEYVADRVSAGLERRGQDPKAASEVMRLILYSYLNKYTEAVQYPRPKFEQILPLDDLSS